ncbi:hypothetical protein FD07_GL002211 [Levilactobacillus parabrevis ATCC 53295]|uniref:Uncharacterized protein n=1 Tax=Levilactobacillus parabrevis ATCC 53295 TaxID=1267003 RepID=A0A0R1H2B9_9LACO|nr:hypothetical protein FD07_GL002211 [Levilactobacillus parabrevis ATCC 53295]KRO06432.1 hypothetical protein IV61_GL000185 [Levilactobacillus parabrevis]
MTACLGSWALRHFFGAGASENDGMLQLKLFTRNTQVGYTARSVNFHKKGMTL